MYIYTYIYIYKYIYEYIHICINMCVCVCVSEYQSCILLTEGSWQHVTHLYISIWFIHICVRISTTRILSSRFVTTCVPLTHINRYIYASKYQHRVLFRENSWQHAFNPYIYTHTYIHIYMYSCVSEYHSWVCLVTVIECCLDSCLSWQHEFHQCTYIHMHVCVRIWTTHVFYRGFMTKMKFTVLVNDECSE